MGDETHMQGEIKATGFNETVDTFYDKLAEGKVSYWPRVIDEDTELTIRSSLFHEHESRLQRSNSTTSITNMKSRSRIRPRSNL